MADVFISYARADRSFAERLAAELAVRGFSVWWDRKILVGRSFSHVIERELDAARCVVVLWSATSVRSDWVLSEAAEGARRKILVPALIDNVRIPLEFSRLHAANLVSWAPGIISSDFEDCLTAIDVLVSPPRQIDEDREAQDDLRSAHDDVSSVPMSVASSEPTVRAGVLVKSDTVTKTTTESDHTATSRGTVGNTDLTQPAKVVIGTTTSSESAGSSNVSPFSPPEVKVASPQAPVPRVPSDASAIVTLANEHEPRDSARSGEKPAVSTDVRASANTDQQKTGTSRKRTARKARPKITRGMSASLEYELRQIDLKRDPPLSWIMSSVVRMLPWTAVIAIVLILLILAIQMFIV
jgi:hypothetical protein